MIHHLRALRDAVTAAGVPCHIGQVPTNTPLPYASLSGPGWDTPEDVPVCGPGDDLAADVRLLVTDTTESNVYVSLSQLRRALTPNLSPAPLAVPGRVARIEWVRSEFVATDRDVTYGSTNRHPGYGVDTYRITSQPA